MRIVVVEQDCILVLEDDMINAAAVSVTTTTTRLLTHKECQGEFCQRWRSYNLAY